MTQLYISMQRPKIATVFGTLNIAVAGWIILRLIVSLAVLRIAQSAPVMMPMQQNPMIVGWTKISSALGFFSAIFLAIAGVGLLLVKNWGRILSIIYAIYALLFGVVSLFATFAFMIVPIIEHSQRMSSTELGTEIGVAIGVMIRSLVALIYPVLLLVFMLRRKFVEEIRVAQQSPVQQPVYHPAP